MRCFSSSYASKFNARSAAACSLLNATCAHNQASQQQQKDG
jgi:hypothetical protein